MMKQMRKLWAKVFISFLLLSIFTCKSLVIKNTNDAKDMFMHIDDGFVIKDKTSAIKMPKWSERDTYYLYVIADLKGGDEYQRAYNMKVAINKSYDQCRSIIAIVSDEIPEGYQYEESEINDEAYNMVLNGYDQTNGSLEWI